MIVAGFGYRGAATVASLRAALAATGHATPDALAVPDDKTGAACIRALAQETGIAVHGVDAAALQAQDTPTQAERVIEKRGTGSVAEACALAVAGAGAVLLTTRHISDDRMASCAIARGAAT